jgi:hypothetical protein
VTACRCQFCHDPLDPAQELRFLVEIQNLDNPAYLEQIRQLPAVGGKPLRVCKPCQAKVEATPNRLRAVPRPAAAAPTASGVLAACGLLSVGLVLFAFLGGEKA